MTMESGCRAAVRAFRPRRVLPAFAVALPVTVGGALVAVQIASVRIGHPALPPAQLEHAVRLMRATRWSDPAALGASAGVALAGLILVLAAVLPGRGRTVALSGDDAGFIAGITRPGLRTALRAAVFTVPGITDARIGLRGRLRPRAVVRAATRFRNPDSLQDQVAEAARARLAGIDPVRTPKVVVRVRHAED